jgi:hypothetical protein
MAATRRPLPPCGGGLGRGVNRHLSASARAYLPKVAHDPSLAAPGAGAPSFAISPARGERVTHPARRRSSIKCTTSLLPPCGRGVNRHLSASAHAQFPNVAHDPSLAALGAGAPSFAISPARGERVTHPARRRSSIKCTTSLLPPCGGRVDRHLLAFARAHLPKVTDDPSLAALGAGAPSFAISPARGERVIHRAGGDRLATLMAATPHPLPPCGGGLGRGVSRSLTAAAHDPSLAPLRSLRSRSFAISPARGERVIHFQPGDHDAA